MIFCDLKHFLDVPIQQGNPVDTSVVAQTLQRAYYCLVYEFLTVLRQIESDHFGDEVKFELDVLTVNLVTTLAVGLHLDAALLQTAFAVHVVDVGLDLLDRPLEEGLPDTLPDGYCEDEYALKLVEWFRLGLFLSA